MGTYVRLERLYRCKMCGESFLFIRDKDDHTQQTGHQSFAVHSLALTGCEA